MNKLWNTNILSVNQSSEEGHVRSQKAQDKAKLKIFVIGMIYTLMFTPKDQDQTSMV